MHHELRITTGLSRIKQLSKLTSLATQFRNAVPDKGRWFKDLRNERMDKTKYCLTIFMDRPLGTSIYPKCTVSIKSDQEESRATTKNEVLINIQDPHDILAQVPKWKEELLRAFSYIFEVTLTKIKDPEDGKLTLSTPAAQPHMSEPRNGKTEMNNVVQEELAEEENTARD